MLKSEFYRLVHQIELHSLPILCRACLHNNNNNNNNNNYYYYASTIDAVARGHSSPLAQIVVNTRTPAMHVNIAYAYNERLSKE